MRADKRRWPSSFHWRASRWRLRRTEYANSASPCARAQSSLPIPISRTSGAFQRYAPLLPCTPCSPPCRLCPLCPSTLIHPRTCPPFSKNYRIRSRIRRTSSRRASSFSPSMARPSRIKQRPKNGCLRLLALSRWRCDILCGGPGAEWSTPTKTKRTRPTS